MTAATLMVQGTASGVGKSLMTTALCRIFALRGWRVAPFKAQNMSNNAGVTVDGGEVARAQVLQARAAGVAPDVRMNPILLKPLADHRSDVVVLGRSRPELRALPWHERRDTLWPHVRDSLDELRAEYDLVVIEGAGSPAETNLRASDVVNMAVAHHACAPVLLVADIDRGGAFAALYGTWALLDEHDRSTLRGFVLNRFRGDAALLHPAPADLEARTGVPTVGCVPFIRHTLPEEDAACMQDGDVGSTTIAAVRLPHIANFDDLDPIAAAGVRVRWVTRPEQLHGAAAIVIPGTRNTIYDLRWLWESGLAAAVRTAAQHGTQVVGLCGGFQMLGTNVLDPHALEAGGESRGLGLLEMTTVLQPAKQVRQQRATLLCWPFASEQSTGASIQGYEIHHGATERTSEPSWLSAEGVQLGAARASVWGTYLHGIFEDDTFRSAWLASIGVAATNTPWEQGIENEISMVAAHVGANLDVDRIEQWLHRP